MARVHIPCDLPFPAPLHEIRHTLDVATSYDAGRDVLGLAILLRAPGKRAGLVLEEYAEAWAGLPKAPVETFVIFRALEIALDRKLRILRIRSADNASRRRLKKNHLADVGHEGQSLQGIVLRLARSFDLVQFAYVPRRKNWQARLLARNAVSSLPPRNSHPIFVDLPPRPRRPLPEPPPFWEEDESDDESDDDLQIPF